jgi:hypothetical protein
MNSDHMDAGGVRCAPMVRLQLGSSAELVYFPTQKKARVLSPAEVRLLGACSHFADVGEHARQLLNNNVEADNVSEILNAFAEEGMMISRAELLQRGEVTKALDPPPRISCLAIPTSNRPGHLQRALKSYANHFSKVGRSIEFVVADDGQSPQSCQLSKEVSDRQAETGDSAVVYVGPGEKRQLIARLAEKHSVPRRALEFGILGPAGLAPTIGANRNTIVLQTAGKMVLSVDDDTICDPCSTTESNSMQSSLGKEGDPAEYWFFADRDSVLAFARPVSIDIVGAHETLLGKPIWTLVGQGWEGQVDLDSACSHLIQSIWTGGGRVVITQNGSAGDSGMYSGRGLALQTKQETRSRLLESEQQYRLALRSREILRQPRFPAVCHGGAFLGGFFGFDNRCLLPPFFPIGRHEDATVGYMIGHCLDSCYFGYLPWSLIHDPPGARAYRTDDVASVRISDLLIACISPWNCPVRTFGAAERLRSLGQHLLDVGSMPPGDFQEFLTMSLWRHTAQGIARKEAMLRQYGGQPTYWAADLLQEIKARQAAVTDPRYAVPIDLPEYPCVAESLRVVQSLIRSYGELVYWWPVIVERAKEVAASD